MSTRKYRNIIHNEDGSYPILETLISISISIILLTVFFTSLTDTYVIHDRPGADLDDKNIGIVELLISSSGQGSPDNPNWEDDPSNLGTLGLGTSPIVAYGIIYIDPETGEVTIEDYHEFSDDDIGVVEACFLAGTQVLMTDGSYKNIEDIEIGDMVKSYDLETSRLVSGRVNKVFHHPSEEMSDYYLVINDALRVTPDHRFYSDGKWVYAGDLEIGDTLFHPVSDYTIYSIEKIFEKQPVYDLEVAVYHNYFVSMDVVYVLVHNAKPHAEFTWFDEDGLAANKTIFFDASESEGDIVKYEWDWDSNGVYVDAGSTATYSKVFGDNNPHVVTLRVTAGGKTDNCSKIVQANTFQTPDIEPWTEADIEAYPSTDDQTFGQYDERYFVTYTKISDEYYLYEIKEKTNSHYTILDYNKVNSLSNLDYYDVKSALGLTTSKYNNYNFNISVSRGTGLTFSFGAYYDLSTVTGLDSISREVLIYHKPKTSGTTIIKPPYYENGRITVRLFLGGIPPNNPPSFGTHSLDTESLIWSIEITDPDGDKFNWTIECSNGNTASGTGERDGFKQLQLSSEGLAYSIPYTIWVNATDIGSGKWAHGVYTFTIEETEPTEPWWNCNWAYRKKITISSSQVADNLTNFPIIVSITDSDLASNAQDDGDDIVFIGDDGTKLYHEIELFDNTNGELVAWVNINSLSGSMDTNIWMYYANSYCDSQENPTAAWDSNYKGVWHFDENYALDFDGSSDYVNIGEVNPTQLTVESWFKADTLPMGSWASIIMKQNSYGYELENDHLQWTLWEGATKYRLDSGVLSADTWYHAVATFNGTTHRLYINANEVASNSAVHSQTTSNNLLIGAWNTNPAEVFDGVIDDVRIYDRALSLDEITDNYHGKVTRDGLVAEYKMNEGTSAQIIDSSGNNNHGAINGATWTSGLVRDSTSNNNYGTNNGATITPYGQIAGAYHFDGTTSRILVDHNASLDLGTDATIEAWVKTADHGSGDFEGFILEKSSAAYGNYYYIKLSTGTAYARFWDTDTGDSIAGSTTTNNDAWHYIVGVKDGSSGYIYVDDGDYENSGTAGNNAGNGGDLEIGRNFVAPDRYFNGIIDEVRISNAPRSAEWIQTTYNTIYDPDNFLYVGTVEMPEDCVNQPPSFSNENPSDGSTVVSVSTTTLSVDISDPDGDSFDWMITTNPDIGQSSRGGESNGTKTCSISDLQYNTLYTWTVIATDTKNNTNIDTYTFTTEEEPVHGDWLTGWGYRKMITITETSGNTLTDYQIKLDVSYDSDMKPDFSDLRFTKDDKVTELNYWIEEYTPFSRATIWVKVPSIPTTGTTIYVYYGNAGAISNSSGVNTFEFFDDFSANTISNYNVVGRASSGGGAVPVVFNYNSLEKNAYFEADDNEYMFIAPIENIDLLNVRVGADIKIEDIHIDGSGFIALAGRYQDYLTSYTGLYADADYPSPSLRKNTGTEDWIGTIISSAGTSEFITKGIWYHHEFSVSDNNLKMWLNGIEKLSTSDPDISTSGGIAIRAGEFYGYFDNLYVAKYTFPEPTYMISGEESQGDG